MLRDRLAGEVKIRLQHLQRVPGAALVSLQDESDSRRLNRGTHAVSLMADDAEDFLRPRYRLRCGDDVQQQRAAANLMQDLGTLALQPRSLARGHDGDCKTG